jgi:hypothetical protein
LLLLIHARESRLRASHAEDIKKNLYRNISNLWIDNKGSAFANLGSLKHPWPPSACSGFFAIQTLPQAPSSRIPGPGMTDFRDFSARAVFWT